MLRTFWIRVATLDTKVRESGPKGGGAAEKVKEKREFLGFARVFSGFSPSGQEGVQQEGG